MEHPGTFDLQPVILLLPFQLDDVDGDVVDVPAGPDGSHTAAVVLRLQNRSHSRELLQEEAKSSKFEFQISPKQPTGNTH